MEHESERMEEDSIADEFLDIPKGCLFDQLRPKSPTAVTDFPCNKEHPMTVYLAESLQLKVSNTSKLPQVASMKDQLEPMVHAVQQLEENAGIADSIPPQSIVATTMVADIGLYGHTYLSQGQTTTNVGKMADSGANCCMTNQWHLLQDVKELPNPVTVGMALEADGSQVEMAKCKYVGDLILECDDGHEIQTKCFYNPYASDTIISPQAILDHSPQFTQWTQIGTRLGQTGVLQFTGPQETRQITLHQQNGLYYCNTIRYDIFQSNTVAIDEDIDWTVQRVTVDDTYNAKREPGPKKGVPRTARYQPTTKAKILEAETWSL